MEDHCEKDREKHGGAAEGAFRSGCRCFRVEEQRADAVGGGRGEHERILARDGSGARGCVFNMERIGKLVREV